MKALREAIANALIHRDYSTNTDGAYIYLRIFDDRIEILNPSGLYGNNRLENLGSDNMLEVRNTTIIRLLEDTTDIVENRHTGIATSCIYIVTLFTRKKKIIQVILAIILTVASIVTLVLFKNFSLLFSIPCIVLLISEFIKCKKAKHVFLIILFESYFFVVIQLIIQAVQYTIWLKWIWK